MGGLLSSVMMHLNSTYLNISLLSYKHLREKNCKGNSKIAIVIMHIHSITYQDSEVGRNWKLNGKNEP